MASCGNPSVEADAIMPRRPKFDRSRECVRCKTGTGSIVVRHAVYCKDCFFPLVSTKFRRCLEPSINATPDGPRRTTLKASGNLLIGLSGGLGSTVLLDVVFRCYFPKENSTSNLKGGKDHPRNVRVWPKAAVCYVEVCSAFPGMRDRTEEVRAVVANYGTFDFIPLRIEDAFDHSWWERVGGKPAQLDLGIDVATEALLISTLSHAPQQTNPISSLHSYMSSLPTQTAIPSTIQTLTRLLLLYSAQSTNSSHLLLGTSLTSLSISLISSISQGGGFVVREETQEEWTPNAEEITKTIAPEAIRKKRSIRVNRPLRDIGMKECAAWAWWSGLKVVGREKFPQAKQGIGALTKDFIVGLERDYPSTVSTITRTCAKLAPKEGKGGMCVLCERPAQLGVQDWKSRISIRSFAEQSHAPYPPHLQSSDLTPLTSSTLPSLTPHLCYACHTTLTSRSSRGVTSNSKHSSGPQEKQITDSVVLPVWVRSHLSSTSPFQSDEGSSAGGENIEGELWAGKKMKESEMKSTIDEFLLDE